MASLFDTVKQNGSVLNVAKGTSPGQSASPTTSQLASQTGSSLPSGPVAAAALGATPKQAAAATTPNGWKAQSNALLTQVKGSGVGGAPKDLQTALREQQVKPIQDAGTQAANAVAQQLAGFGSLSNAVPGLVQQATANDAAQASGIGLEVNTAAIPANLSSAPSVNLSGLISAAGVAKYTGSAGNQLQSALQTIGTPGTGSQDLQDAIVTAYTAQGQSVPDLSTPAAILAAVTSLQTSFLQPSDTAGQTAQAIGDVAAGKTVNGVQMTPATVTVGQLSPSSLGATSFDQLGQELGGLSAAAVKAMTVQQLGQAIQTIQTKGYNTEADWKSVLTNPVSSLQERATARQMLEGMGASGITEAEATVAKVSQQVQAANMVTVNGQQMTIGDALSSTTVQALISTILNPADPGNAAAVAGNPALTAWANAHVAELQGIVSNVSAAAQTLQATITSNLAPVSGFSDPAGMASIYAPGANLHNSDQTYDWGTMSATLTSIAANADLKASFEASTSGLQSISADGASIPPDILAEMRTSSLSDWEAKGIVYNGPIPPPPGSAAQVFNSQIAQAAVAHMSDGTTPTDTVTATAMSTVAGLPQTSGATGIMTSMLALGTSAGISTPASQDFPNGVNTTTVGAFLQAQPSYNPFSSTQPVLLGGATGVLTTSLAEVNSGIGAIAGTNPNLGSLATAIMGSTNGQLSVAAITTLATTAANSVTGFSGGSGSVNDLAELGSALTSIAGTVGLTAAQINTVMTAATNTAITTATNNIIKSNSTIPGVNSLSSLQDIMSLPSSANDAALHGQIDQTIESLEANASTYDSAIQTEIKQLAAGWQNTKGGVDKTNAAAAAQAASVQAAVAAQQAKDNESNPKYQAGQALKNPLNFGVGLAKQQTLGGSTAQTLGKKLNVARGIT